MKITIKNAEEAIIEDVSEQEFEAYENSDEVGRFDSPLEYGYRQWKKRRQLEKLCNAESREINLVEDLLYSSLPDNFPFCFRLFGKQ
ncbi:MAG: hypothetical protein Q4E34_03865 [Synergistaceae bacterium]|nr:hypothetical protein [Synergistaceae bacterium]